jgi:hypothetical protein
VCALGIVICLAVLAGCAGEDLTKQNFSRTTVPAEGGGEDVPDMPDDPVLSMSALRAVDSCALLNENTLAEVGSPTGEPNDITAGLCHRSATDPGGKELNVQLVLGLAAVPDSANGELAGLPLVRGEADDDQCGVLAVTTPEGRAGVQTSVRYPGGDPCAAAVSVLEKVIGALRDDPQRVDIESGSLREGDPCAGLSEKALEKVGMAGEDVSTNSLFGCGAGVGPSVTERFAFDSQVRHRKHTEEVDIAEGVTALVEPASRIAGECKAEWVHRPAGGDEGEVVTVEYRHLTGDESAEQACEKAVVVAESVVGELPEA